MKNTQDENDHIVRQSPRQRFETALKVLSDPILRLKVRRIWETEMQNCSVFWDESERQIELVGNTHEIIIREHSTQNPKQADSRRSLD
jgi:hypothetical protein